MRTILGIMILLLAGQVRAQNESTLVERLHRPVADCETIAGNAHQLIADVYYDNIDSMDYILNLWEGECGAVEPVLRLKILLDIMENSYADSNYSLYFRQYITKYKNRINASAMETYFNEYEKYKTYFDYVPLRSRFDRLTRGMARDMLPDQQRGTTAYLLALLFSDDLEAYERELKQPLYAGNPIREEQERREQVRYPWEIDLTLYAGMWSPTGRMAQIVDRNWNLGLLLGSPMGENYRMDYGLIFNFARNSRPFEMYVGKTYKMARAKHGLTIGLWFTREFRFENDMALDAVAGLGFGVLTTDLEKDNPAPDESKNYELNTADFSLGVNVRKRVAGNNSLGLNLSWHLVPYKWDDTLTQDIGSSFIRFNLFFRFDRLW